MSREGSRSHPLQPRSGDLIHTISARCPICPCAVHPKPLSSPIFFDFLDHRYAAAFSRKNRRLHRELVALVRVGACALNEWRTEHPDRPVRLDHAKLANADLRGANLRDANLAHADLSHADLSGADLTATTLRGASLRYANLEGVRGLTPVQLAGCDLAGTVLPASVDPAALAESAALGESVGHTRHLFMWMAGMCAFCLLTLAVDALLSVAHHGRHSDAADIQRLDSHAAFFQRGAHPVHRVLPLLPHLLAAIVGTARRSPGCLPRRPAAGPQDERLDHAQPRAAAAEPRSPSCAMGRTQTALNVALAYGMVPATMLIIWWRYALRHEWDGSILHAAAVAWTVYLAIGFYAAATGALRGKKRRVLLWGRYAVAFGVLFGLQHIMHGSFYGEGRNMFNVQIDGEDVSTRPSRWFVTRLDLLRRYKQTLPPAWLARPGDPRLPPSANSPPAGTLADFEKDFFVAYEQIRGAQLVGVNLSGATISDAHFAVAELPQSDLAHAKVMQTDMSRVVLDWSRMQYAELTDVWLAGASLQGVNLSQAELFGVTAFGANLNDADMFESKAYSHCDFRRAQMLRATLTRGDFTRTLFSNAKLDDAKLDRAVLDGAIFEDASLARVDLRGSSLKGASLKNTDLTGAKLGQYLFDTKPPTFGGPKTNLCGADLTGCIGLTKEQLALAEVDATTKLPEYLVEKPPKPESPAIAATPPPKPPSAAPPAQKLAETPSAPTEAGPAPAQPAPPAGEEVAERDNPLRQRR